MTAPVSIRKLGMTFEPSGRPATQALEGIDLEIDAGEFIAVVGASGCGKTTLLRILAGLTRPTEGRALIGDRVVTRPHPDVAIMFQSPTLLPWRSVIENCFLPVQLRNRIRPGDRARSLELLERAGLGGFEDRLPHELSGGMQQRVALCRALIADPAIMLLDEPFGALDAMTRDQMNLDLRRMWARKSITTVLITHSISEAVFLAQRVVVMSPRPGRIVDVVDVPLPHDRTLDLLDSPEFTRTSAHIRSYFRGEENADIEAASAGS